MDSTSKRGYGAAHQRERKKWEAAVAQGDVMCARQGPKCVGQPIKPGQAWDLGHNDDRTQWTGPECVPCNRGAGGSNGAAATNAKRQTVTRDW
jgi:hypothetical protein